jgi:hypothetical protein
VPDDYTIPADKQLVAVVSQNDEHMNATGVTYSFSTPTSPQVYAPGSTTATFLGAGFSFNNTGRFSFNPATQGIKAGARVTFNYTINASPSGYRSRVGVVTINVTDATGPFPPPPPSPPPMLGAGEHF